MMRCSMNSKNYGWNIGLSLDGPITKKIRFSHFSSGGIVTQKGQGFENSSLTGYINERVYYNLARKQRLAVSVNAFSPNITLQGKDQSMAYIKTALSYSYFMLVSGNPSQIGISVTNPWLTKGYRSFVEQTTPALYYYNESFAANPYVSLQLVINFKGKRYKENSFNRSKSIQNNDLKTNN